MKKSYRGHEITVTREPSMSGVWMLFYSIFRESDGYECTSGFEDSKERVAVKIGHLKRLVDKELHSPDPWGEKSQFE